MAGCCKRPTSNYLWDSPELLLLLTDGLELLGSALVDLLGLPDSSLSSFDAALQPCQGRPTGPCLQVQQISMSKPTNALLAG